MIKTKVESISSDTAFYDIKTHGSTEVLLLELRALVIAVLSNMTLSAEGTDRELTIDERIELFCKLMKR